jgi:hypothetical protein
MATPKPAKPTLTQFAPLVDELGALEVEMAPHAQKLKRIDALRKALRGACPAKPAAQWTVDGNRFIAVLGPCSNQRLVDIPALVKAIGATMYAKFATCSLKDIEEYVAPAIVAAVVTDHASGSRPLETFQKPGLL